MNNFSSVPQISIHIDGAVLRNEIIDRIECITIKQCLSAPSQCEFVINESQQDFSDTAAYKVGSLLSVQIEQHDQTLFHGQITAIDFAHSSAGRINISIRAYDLLHQLRKHQPVRTHVQVNLYQLAEELTRDLGIRVHGGEHTPSINKLIQYQQSDLQLLQEFGECYGQYFFLHEHELQIFNLEGTGPEQHLTLGDTLLESRFSINAETNTESMTVTGWNPQRNTPHNRTVQDSEYSTNSEYFIDPSDFGSRSERTLVDHNVLDQQQAEMAAQTELDRRVVQQVTCWGVTEGNPLLRPGSLIHISGVALDFEGVYLLSSVTHTINAQQGYLCEFNTNPPYIEKNSSTKTASTGIVSQVNDPDNMARIKVTLPTYNNIETEWLQVLMPGAGANKGQLILPDIGDHVLLLMVNGQPGQAVVLGGLYAENELPHTVIDDAAVKHYVTRTAGNQIIHLDDSENAINISTQNGHRICLTPDDISITRDNGSFMSLTDNDMTLHAASDLKINAPGKTITISAKNINFEKA